MTIYTEEELALNVSNVVDIMSFDSKLFGQQILREHRTVQQAIGSTFLEVLRQWAVAYETNNYDLRNKDICNLSSKIFKLLEHETDEPIRLRHI